jgi:diguanylate cyclase (GGDEF)-like protein
MIFDGKGMGIRAQISLRIAAIQFAAALSIAFVSYSLVVNVIDAWGTNYAAQQVRYNKSKALQPILRELALARQLTRSPVIVAWASDPENLALRKSALRELETSRENFKDQSYFVALKKNNKYYYNNAHNDFLGRQHRYDLDPESLSDQWFYTLLKLNQSEQINISHDVKLGVTNVWMNVAIRNPGNGEILGFAGTGLNLDDFIRDFDDGDVPGVKSLLVDDTGATQVYRERGLINYASLTTKPESRRTFFDLLTSTADRDEIRRAMSELQRSPNSVLTKNVRIGGGRSILSVEFIPEIGWYDVTLIDLGEVLPLSRFKNIALIYGVATLLALLIIVMFLNKELIAPIELLHGAMRQLSSGSVIGENLPKKGATEIQGLVNAFAKMASEISASRHELEEKVRSRTAELDKLTRSDALTGLLNRRGMSDELERAVSDLKHGKNGVGLLWFDVDYFKAVNDSYGHQVGDEALKLIAGTIKSHVAPGSSVSRWGGDEFLVLLSPAEEHEVDLIAEQVCVAIRAVSLMTTERECIRLAVSIGGYFCKKADSLNSMLEKADQALYAAKDAGRDCYRRHQNGIADEVRSTPD